MNKTWCIALLALVALLIAGRVATAAIVVDGNIGDWPEYFILEDLIGSEEGAADLAAWGTIIRDGVLYGFYDMTVEIEHYLSGTNDIWAGLWIDVDQAGGSSDPSSSLGHNASHLGTEWAGDVFEGFDINIEWGGNTNHWGEGFNYWGAGDNVSQQGSPVVGGQTAYTGTVFEFSVPLGNILAELGTYPDNVSAGPAWKIGARVEASEEGVGPWGGDNSDSLSICSLLSADINGDGLVGSADLDYIRANWGATVTPGDISHGDLDGDGIISGNDLDIVRGYWGAVYEDELPTKAMSVPEPVCALFICPALWMSVLRRRRFKN